MSSGSMVYLVGGAARDAERYADALSAAGLVIERCEVLGELAADSFCAGPRCVLLDGEASSPLDAASSLEQLGERVPLLVVLNEADVDAAVSWMRGGAADVLAPPFDGEALSARVHALLEGDAAAVAGRQRRQAILRRMATLTRREREVMDLVVAGRSNKRVAEMLGVSIKTIEVHRSRVMRKMAAGSLAGLVEQCLFVGRGNGETHGGAH